ncbi:diol dehydratase small subunit [Georgenia daeguensis]|uniref:Diol dehydratase small subunit n=1 Tax=Georgenia daeguensis TaxID=908355 RepID=A0ABP6UM79_9MICO
MDQEELIRQIMAEVMKNLGSENQVAFEKKPVPAGATVGVADYPLAERRPELVRTDSGARLAELTFERLKSGELKPSDFKISADTLELQAQVADDVGRGSLARNLRRAAELVAVPDDRLLAIYDALRPYRSTKKELLDIAAELEGTYDAKAAGIFVREAAEVYQARGRLRVD